MASPLQTIRRVRDALRVAAARRSFVRQIRPTDVFIVGFPKSGNSWLCYMFAKLVNDDPNSEVTFKDSARLVPDVNDFYYAGTTPPDFSLMRDPRFFRAHATWEPQFPKVIYILRDPRDTLVSYWHFERMMRKNFSQPVDDFVLSDGHWPCRWDRHIAQWLYDHRHPHLLTIRYEDLHRDPAELFSRAVKFSGIDASSDRIARAVEESRFSEMRKVEETHGLARGTTRSDERFVRKGQVGSGAEELRPETIRALEAKYAGVMNRLGYLPLESGAGLAAGPLR